MINYPINNIQLIMKNILKFVCYVFFSVLFCLPVLQAADWPMWRHDASRSAASTHELDSHLQLHWKRELPSPSPAWPEQREDGNKLEFDLSHQPIVYDGMVYITKASNDALLALDLFSGEVKWRFYAEAPFRLAPAAENGRIYAVSDDGYLYCLDASDGELHWKFRGGPASNRILGNERMISAWPARGGPVLGGGKVYFAAGSFPFMGIFIHALDAETGERVWTNSTSGSEFVRQVHQRSGSFAGVTPQGYLTIDDEYLIVAGGRSRPAVYLKETGEFLYFEKSSRPAGKAPPWEGGPVYGGYDALAAGGHFLVHGEMMRTEDGEHIDWLGTYAASVLGPDGIYGVRNGRIVFHSLSPAVEDAVDRRGRETQRYSGDLRWEVEGPDDIQQIHIKAGGRLYGTSGDGNVFALSLAENPDNMSKQWEAQVDGKVWTMLAGGGRLLVMTEEGVLYVYGPAREADAVVHQRPEKSLERRSVQWDQKAERILGETGVSEGYAVVVGIDDGGLAEELLRRTGLHVIIIDEDEKKVAELRDRLDSAGFYGKRAAAFTTTLSEANFPPYFAELVLSESMNGTGFSSQEAEFVEALAGVLRPYTGYAEFSVEEAKADNILEWLNDFGIESVLADYEDGRIRLKRRGPLPGAGAWTHQNADTANTGISEESRVRAPLGLLWFGGPSNRNLLPRHGRGPIPQVAGGRIYNLGPDSLQARDVYTGRKLWKKNIPGIGSYYDTVRHQTGADQTGAPYVSGPDSVYLVHGDVILHLDSATGEEINRFPAPPNEQGQRPDWGFISVWNNKIIAGLEPLIFDERRPGGDNWNAISSRYLVVLNKNDGEIMWRKDSDWGFRHNAIVTSQEGRVFVVDRMPEEVRGDLLRRGLGESDPKIYCLDVDSGDVIWEVEDNVFGTWLGYSEEYDLLLQSGRPAVDGRQSLPGELDDRMAVLRGSDGTLIWDRDVSYSNAPLIHEGSIIVHGKAFCLLTGEDKKANHPLTGEQIDWRFHASRNCGQIVGSANLLTYRRGASTYYDLKNHSGSGSLGGFRAGCTPNLIAADGVLSAPDYTRDCICSYQFQTSLAMIAMEEVEGWTFNRLPQISAPVQQGGINLGAQGDRWVNSTLWLTYPSIHSSGGTSAQVPLYTTGAQGATGTVIPVDIYPEHPEWTRFSFHPMLVQGADSPWISSSGIEGEVTIELDLKIQEEYGPKDYTIALYFLEPRAREEGKRVFDVILQDGEQVVSGLDIFSKAEGGDREVVITMTEVSINNALKIELRSRDQSKLPPLICGVEFREER